ncbi:MAG: MurR/RpiR family transcriptional regulator, partial [Clostridiales bacterium]|nr:MurR/RpiR family transcriptional regulator [Clostridiales bacterium]
MDNFEKRLSDSFDSLTKSHQSLVKYLLKNMDNVVFMTALQIAKDVNLSETTVIRLAYKLGYDSFSSMHKAMQENAMANKNRETDGENDIENITRYLSDRHYEHLYKIFNNAGLGMFEHICDMFMQAESILVMGYKDSYGVAVELMRVLEKVRPRVYFHRWTRDRNDIVNDIVKDSLMVSISFTPHSRFTVTETEFMKKIGCKVIAFTDSVVNPLRHVADYNPILEISRDEVTGFINTSPAISLLDYMVHYLYK